MYRIKLVPQPTKGFSKQIMLRSHFAARVTAKHYKRKERKCTHNTSLRWYTSISVDLNTDLQADKDGG